MSVSQAPWSNIGCQKYILRNSRYWMEKCSFNLHLLIVWEPSIFPTVLAPFVFPLVSSRHPPSLGFHFPLSRVTAIRKYYKENSRKKPFISFNASILSSVIKPQAVPLPPTLDGNHPCVQRIHTVHTTCPFIT